MQNLVNAPASSSQQTIIVKNQLFHYPDPPYPQNLPPLDSDKYNPKHHDSSDILSPRLPQRNMPMLSDGHRPNNYTPHSKPCSQVPQSSLGDSFTKRGGSKLPQESTMPSLFQHGGGLTNRAIHVNLSTPGTQLMLQRKPVPLLPRLSKYLQYQSAPEIITEVQKLRQKKLVQTH